ncbi:MAG: von Willebrand factor type A domain-containing protein [Myxococcota bacterium]
MNGTTGGATEEEPVPPVLLCADGAPLVIGDAGWASPPFEPPVKGNPVDEDGADGEDEPDGDDEPGGGNDGVSTGGGFITDPDGGGVSVECSVWDQDCSRGEKCAPWANDGGSNHNATKCVPVAPDAGVHGDACTVEGSGVSGVDDCDLGVLCFDVPKDGTDGTCVAMCSGTEENPMCPEGTQCVIDNDGVLPLCLPEMLCVEDGVCQCMCEKTADPDCEPEQCDAPDAPALDPLDLRTQRSSEAESTCPETSSDLELYMSNDDSNSQASPALARAYIEQGDIVPASRVRIHEFLNYYDLSYDNPTDETASVGIQMRRTDPDSGEFTLMVSARSRQMTAEDRPALNLVFSLDTSGSMKGAPMDNLKASMVATASALRAGDVISIVTWAHEQQLVLDGLEVAGPDDPALLQVVDGLVAAGSTDLHGGLVAGYQLANAHHIDGGINRVMLISDGGANAGVTDLDLIASEASDSDGEGTYLLGVGVGVPETYEDTLMDAVTDAGKGAYLFIDSEAEAHRMLDERFLANTMVVARNVRAKLSLPWYFGIKSFHGEEYSSDPAEVEPQHLGPNDTMTFHQVISACEPALITDCDSVSAHIEYTDPLTGEVHSDERTVQIQDLVVENAHVLRKADVVVGYAKALIVIGSMTAGGNADGAAVVASNMAAWTAAAAEELDDPEVDEIAGLMAAYAATVAPADEGE